MTLVADASVLVAALVDSGPDGSWALALIADEQLAAPHLVMVETANVLRRLALSGAIPAQTADLAHEDLLALPIQLAPYDLLARRVWQLRETLTSFDACYVALAEELAVPLATLDRRLARSTGPRCRMLTPPARP
ncbi:type II toxin-antitoxin system VapC family toxin [Nocardioides sp. HDW12B]|uniref:type II toxin-antitoxin system VapC family toxin n=1 Tax=Nocardioides sp. HDW12B TaxID=2714939 RepID=UPI001408EC71|nr:type II toxin-antitoxin system VapC family toxin [Nocardioides sp. HDW12B]QIK67284.1 type II toxin-antitoxin system VapC family toxin [Nocardioides sp. HDW12B]